MKADSGRRYRAYPTDEQAARLTSWGHTCRWLYNVALEQRRFAWAQRRVSFGTTRQCAELTAARRELDWVADLPAQAGQQVLRHLDQSYRNWWNPAHPAGAPVRKRRGSRLAVPLPGQAVTVRRLNRRWGQVTVPKLGAVKFRWTRPLGGTVRNLVLSSDGRDWHVAFGVATGQPDTPTHPHSGRVVGLDRGVIVAVATSDGDLHDRASLTPGEARRMTALARRAGRQEHHRRESKAKRRGGPGPCAPR
ncbi:transposase [Longispora fulva]|uniref:Transposase n=1 Tax=Longispora fulva TaxID=619741 RepID=A0A8J7G7E5_9ACTN|nr:transposase [Longispora fulva]